MSGCDRPALKLLNKHVRKEVSSKWYDLGLELLEQEDEEKLNEIETNNPKDAGQCCKEMFRLWLRKCSTATWDQLIQALKVTRHEKTRLKYTKYTYSYYSMYLHYCTRFTKSVNCIRFPMNSFINGENCTGIPCVYMKLFNFENQKCGQIFCAHKPYFLMLGHKRG